MLNTGRNENSENKIRHRIVINNAIYNYLHIYIYAYIA